MQVQRRVALVAAASMAVALVGAFAVMWVFGLSVNILTLVALILSVGIAADDAVPPLATSSALRRFAASSRLARDFFLYRFFIKDNAAKSSL